jgi:hypothetical protein
MKNSSSWHHIFFILRSYNKHAEGIPAVALHHVRADDWLAVWDAIIMAADHLRLHGATPGHFIWWQVLIKGADEAFMQGNWAEFLRAAQLVVRYVNRVSGIPFGPVQEQ